MRKPKVLISNSLFDSFYNEECIQKIKRVFLYIYINKLFLKREIWTKTYQLTLEWNDWYLQKWKTISVGFHTHLEFYESIHRVNFAQLSVPMGAIIKCWTLVRKRNACFICYFVTIFKHSAACVKQSM